MVANRQKQNIPIGCAKGYDGSRSMNIIKESKDGIMIDLSLFRRPLHQ